MTVYGLPNCDTTRAAIKWLKERQIPYTFYDFKSEGLSESQVRDWLTKVPVEKLLNKQSTAWRGLSPEEQATANTIDGAVSLITKYSNLVKRPLIAWPGGSFTVGYKEEMLTSNLTDR